MGNNKLKNIITIGALCTFLVMSVFIGEGAKAISTEGYGHTPISYELNQHWAKVYVEQLLANYDVATVFEKKDLNTTIKLEDFQKLVKVIDEDYEGAPDAMTREAVVHELTKIWAQKTGQDLDKIATIKMVIYSDTDQIDAKYNHSITVAYMKGIAKGKEESIFAPKAQVTYGELAALICNTIKAIDAELDFKSPIIEERLETKGNYEIKDDKVVFDFELINYHNEPKQLQFGSGQKYEVIVIDEKGEEVYRYSDGKFFTQAIVYETINPGKSLKWQDTWDMTDKKGERLVSGKYTAQIKIMVIPNDDEKFDEDQFTTFINFNLDKPRLEYELTEEGIIKPESAPHSLY